MQTFHNVLLRVIAEWVAPLADGTLPAEGTEKRTKGHGLGGEQLCHRVTMLSELALVSCVIKKV